MTGEKTEQATPKRRKESRKEGQVARTPELAAWATLLVATMALPAMARREAAAFRGLATDCLRATADPSPATGLRLLREGGAQAFWAIVVLGAAVMVLGVAVTLAQGGFYLATKLAKPNAKKLNLIQGAKRLFGPHAWWEGAKTLVKSAAVGLLVYAAVKSMLPVLFVGIGTGNLLALTGERALSLVRAAAVAGLLMAVLDYAWQRRRVGKQTRMSKDEVRQEYRQSEGDPMLKGAIRARQRAASRSRMMADVPEADVVLVNPTHVAVALRYEASSGVPRVVARGAGVIAARIREVAAQSSVPVVRDVPLARALYSSTRVGQEIPAELFAAVAQVLAFIISRRSQGRRGGEHRSPRTESELPALTGRRRGIPSGPASVGR